MAKQNLEQVLEVSVALTAEQDKEKFLTLVLDAAMAVAGCDAGTLYLLEGNNLVFSRMATISRGIHLGGHSGPVDLPPVPMERQYVCAWAVIHRQSVNIPDIRKSEIYDFSGAMKYDRMTGYRTESMLVVPMMGTKGETIGVMQLINALDGEKVIPFPEEIEQTVSALASQAAACILNMRYAKQVSDLLDSLVDAMTTAIDDRTPYNANHSRNMALYAERFLDRAAEKDPAWRWTEDRRRAFLLSVKLHDVGKLVTPLQIMNKETRLGDRLPGIEERFRRMGLLDRIALLEGRITEETYLRKKEDRESMMERIRRMNAAGFQDEEDLRWVDKISGQTFTDENGTEEPVITAEEAECLRIRSGSLTAGERQVMEAHVTETARILDRVRFPEECREIPAWAAAHHEYLDGTGYPEHPAAERIPTEVRLMTILDIFDSLAAADRPYKQARTPEDALGILREMAKKGKLDAGILELFEASRAWEEIYPS